MRLKEYARLHGICYHTALRWFHSGRLPVPAIQTETGVILIEPKPETIVVEKAVIYARVSSHDQKTDLERQVERVRLFASSKGIVVADVISEIASGLNDKRKGFLKILSDPTISHILVEHKDRLGRFGVSGLDAVLRASGRTLVVADETESDLDLVQDFVDLATSFCAKIYGKRSAKNRAKRMMEVAGEDQQVK